MPPEGQGDGSGVVKPAELGRAEECAEHLRNNGIAAVPTDTLYGFAADARSDEGVDALYWAKGRKGNVPIAVCVDSIERLREYGAVDALPDGLLEALLPGPVTLVLARRDGPVARQLSERLSPGLETLGFRLPEAEFVVQVARCLGRPLALTSANAAGEQSTREVSEFRHLWSKVAAVYDGGAIPSESSSGSTVVDLSLPLPQYRILRRGVAASEVHDALARFSMTEL